MLFSYRNSITIAVLDFRLPQSIPLPSIGKLTLLAAWRTFSCNSVLVLLNTIIKPSLREKFKGHCDVRKGHDLCRSKSIELSNLKGMA